MSKSVVRESQKLLRFDTHLKKKEKYTVVLKKLPWEFHMLVSDHQRDIL